MSSWRKIPVSDGLWWFRIDVGMTTTTPELAYVKKSPEGWVYRLPDGVGWSPIKGRDWKWRKVEVPK